MRSWLTIIMLVLANVFMTLAWYGHLRFKYKPVENWGIVGIILVSWGFALVEYCLQVPANRLGFKGTGGPFSLLQLKLLQEVITLVVFILFSLLFFKNESFKLNHLISFVFLMLAVYFAFKK